MRTTMTQNYSKLFKDEPPKPEPLIQEEEIQRVFEEFTKTAEFIIGVETIVEPVENYNSNTYETFLLSEQMFENFLMKLVTIRNIKKLYVCASIEPMISEEFEYIYKFHLRGV